MNGTLGVFTIKANNHGFHGWGRILFFHDPCKSVKSVVKTGVNFQSNVFL